MTKTGRETRLERSTGTKLSTSNPEDDRATPSYLPYIVGIFGGVLQALGNLTKDRKDIITERGERIAKILLEDISASPDLSPSKTQKKEVLQALEIALRNDDLTLIEDITKRCLAHYLSCG
jgi:hypothetical protein